MNYSGLDSSIMELCREIADKSNTRGMEWQRHFDVCAQYFMKMRCCGNCLRNPVHIEITEAHKATHCKGSPWGSLGMDCCENWTSQ
jgi:hypothetical protein